MAGERREDSAEEDTGTEDVNEENMAGMVEEAVVERLQHPSHGSSQAKHHGQARAEETGPCKTSLLKPHGVNAVQRCEI